MDGEGGTAAQGPGREQDLLFLAGELERCVDVLASTQAQLSVWAGAVCALVHTHPDPSAFAAAFRRCWREAGDQHSNSEVIGAAQSGYANALSDLERMCPSPLGVRPPGRD